MSWMMELNATSVNLKTTTLDGADQVVVLLFRGTSVKQRNEQRGSSKFVKAKCGSHHLGRNNSSPEEE